MTSPATTGMRSLATGGAPQGVPLVAKGKDEVSDPLPPLGLAVDGREGLGGQLGEVGRFGEMLEGRGGAAIILDGGHLVGIHAPPHQLNEFNVSSLRKPTHFS